MSYHFPPSGAVGALRWEKMAPFARDHGWALDVITAHPDVLAKLDSTRLRTLPSETRVFAVNPMSHWVQRLERWRAWRASLLPAESRADKSGRQPAGDDDQALLPIEELRWRLNWTALRRAYGAWRYYVGERCWSEPAERLAVMLGSSQKYEAILSSGPPHLAHVAAARAGHRLGVPVVLDFRDPWSLMPSAPEHVASPLWRSLGARYEQEAVSRATLVVTNTALARSAMERRYPQLTGHVITVMNGVDAEALPEAPTRNRFVIAYAGNIYIDRNPRILFRALNRLVRERNLDPTQIGAEFMGNADHLEGRTVAEIAAEEGIEPFVKMLPPGPHAAALQFLAAATVLVSLPQRTPLSIPSKVFEYLRFDAWPLIIAGPETATGRLLEGTSVPVFDPDDVDGMHRFLTNRWDRFARGERPTPLPERTELTREAQARILFDRLRAEIGSPRLPLTGAVQVAR
ncbi:MAG: hypothetical protein ABI647_08425 [Gemmatimonadota bacterium]